MSENKEELVSIPASQLQTILDKIEKLEKGQQTSIVPKKVKERVANLRLHNDKLVIGWDEKKKVYQVFNQMSQSFDDKFDIILKDGNKQEIVTVDYLRFLNDSQKIRVKILEQKAEKIVENAGVVNRVDSKDDRIYPDQYVNLEVESVAYVSKVEVLDGEYKGEIFKIANKFLNI